MSIELHDGKQKESKSFGITVSIPDMKSKSIKIRPKKKTAIEKKKKEDMEKKKEPEIKFFYELLAETWEKKILNRGHTASYDKDSPKCYYCPICCVCERLELIPVIRKSDATTKHGLKHENMVDMLRGKCKFIDGPVNLDVRNCGQSWYSDMQDMNEPMLAFSTAAALTGYINNGDIARLIKEQLYDKLTKAMAEKLVTTPMFERIPDSGLELKWKIVSNTLDSMRTIKLPKIDLDLTK